MNKNLIACLMYHVWKAVLWIRIRKNRMLTSFEVKKVMWIDRHWGFSKAFDYQVRASRRFKLRCHNMDRAAIIRDEYFCKQFD